MSKQDQSTYVSLYTQDANNDSDLIANMDPQPNQKDDIEKFSTLKSTADFTQYNQTDCDYITHCSDTFSPCSSLFNMHFTHLPPTPSSSTSRLVTQTSIDEESTINHNSLFMKQALKAEKKRRGSVGEVILNQRRSIAPRLSRSSILHTNSKKLGYQYKGEQSSEDQSSGLVHWDPHIDTFEILRAKITGITRAMQEFHVQELFQDELLADERRKRISSFPKATTSSPLIPSRSNKPLPALSSTRRLSLANAVEADLMKPKHRRIRSQSSQSSSFPALTSSDTSEAKTNCRDMSGDPKNSNSGEDEDEELEGTRLLKNPNLSALFLTTNNLINSRLDELSETASIKSNKDSDSVSLLEWQKQFLNLVTCCIHQSEELESLSTDILASEHRVRELMLVNETLHEQFQQRERQYEERIRECQEVAQQQLMMIDSLEELTADISMKMESHYMREAHRQEALYALNGGANLDDCDSETLPRSYSPSHRWSFQKPIAELMHMDDKFDFVQKMRWEIGMFVGGGVGTGHVIHTFESKLNGFDMIIAGTGTTTSAPMTSHHSDFRSSQSSRSSCSPNLCATTLYSTSPSLQHLQLYQYRYLLHISRTDRQTLFHLLPRHLWVPDNQVEQCQFQFNNSDHRCEAKFTFFQRKHHCRRCGLILCQKHSANRLPLFSDSHVRGKWSRVCDSCFYELIVQK